MGGTCNKRYQVLAKHHRPQTVQEDAMFEVILHGARERNGFDVATDRFQCLDVVSVVDAFDGLFDDRPLVQIAGDVVRRRANQFHAAFMCVVLRARALEA